MKWIDTTTDGGDRLLINPSQIVSVVFEAERVRINMANRDVANVPTQEAELLLEKLIDV